MDSALRTLFLTTLSWDLELADSPYFRSGFEDPGWQAAGPRWWDIQKVMYFDNINDSQV